MPIETIDLPPVGSGPDRRLPLLLEKGWSRGMERGAIAYDPERSETLSLPPFCFHFLPGRETRPRAPSASEGRGLRRPHAACPFDSDAFLDEREVARVACGGRSYHIALNKYPVLPLHYLAIRPASAPRDTLPQRLGGPKEIEDMLRLASALGAPYRLFFNSNQGGDGSRSGSSVNHWHFQVFPSESPLVEQARNLTSAGGPVTIGRIAAWPARHKLYRSRNGEALGAALWADLQRIDARDIAYNVEATSLGTAELAVLLFPRAPVGDLKLPGAGPLSGDFGGFELTGGVVVPTRAIFDWIRSHPAEARSLFSERLRASTTDH